MLPAEQRRALLDALSPDDLAFLEYDWWYWGRPNQHAPEGDWRTWLILAGRGWGKTRTGAEWLRASVRDFPLVNIIGATADDARDVMIEGESGILAICPPGERPEYLPSKRQLAWPNGAKTLIFTADEPDRLRGKQHMRLWADEVAAWRYPEAWDQAMFGLRLGPDPRAVVTTTPKPVRVVRDLVADPRTHVTRGTTYENRDNLAPAFFEQIIGRYEGTRLGRQELLAELLEDTPGALFLRDRLDTNRVTAHPPLTRIVVGVDPAASSDDQAAEAGIVVAGVAKVGDVVHGYILDDATIRGTPAVWGSAAVAAYHKYHADRIAAEENQGGKMVEHVIRTVPGGKNAAYKGVRASRGKQTRAEPIAALDEQGRIHLVGYFPELEDQICSWTPGDKNSPDRLDAMVWSLTELMLDGASRKVVTF